MATRSTLTAAARLALLTLAASAVTAALLPVATSSWRALTTSPAPNPDDAVALVAAASAAAGSAWFALMSALTVATLDWRRRGTRRSRFAVAVHALAPRLVHRMAAVALSAGIVVGPAQAALAAGPFDPSWAGAGAAGRPGGVSSSAPAQTGPSTQRRPVGEHSPGALAVAAAVSVVVRPGDSLWSIAARHLPPGSSADDVARAWPRWYQANRAAIGDDPDLIVPGQTLTAPHEPRRFR